MGNSGLKQHYDRASKTGVLQISDHKLKEIPVEVFSLCEVLRNLDLSKNKLVNLPDSISKLKNLKHLNVELNKLEALPTSLANLKKLEFVNASNNVLGLKNLEVLELSHNKITGIPSGMYDLFVTELNISQNEISFISEDLHQAPRLKILRLEENCLSLEAIKPSLLRDSKIHTVNLDGNLFETKQLALLEGYNEYIERYTAMKKKMAVCAALQHYVFFMAAALVFSSAPLPLMLLRPFSPKNALLPAALLRYSARLLGMRFTVRGLENVDNSRGTVVLLNHQSCLDLFVLAVLWPLMARCTVISKRTMQYMVPFGTAAWMWGTVFIDRGSRSAHDALKKQARAVKEEKRKLLLFPEGTRHCGDKLLPFRKGAFHVAMDAGAAIQPVVASKYHFLDSERHRFGSGEIIVTILPMVETAGMTKEDLDVLIEKTYSNMQETFTRTSQETRRVVPRLDK
ncbi:hypothetical protein MSG28_000284 [Choristoneura fumiferana]|uniref:Uncharacterized protein n=1 Tax=Choristoneura fumiferana TaxID=7141 RepID=A0ACC0K014_CHOFU|nr:hypothetical protein MSG28_000284 [Choristoneura fumiferana]